MGERVRIDIGQAACSHHVLSAPAPFKSYSIYPTNSPNHQLILPVRRRNRKEKKKKVENCHSGSPWVRTSQRSEFSGPEHRDFFLRSSLGETEGEFGFDIWSLFLFFLSFFLLVVLVCVVLLGVLLGMLGVLDLLVLC